MAHQVPLSVGFSKQEYRSGLPCPPSEDLPGPGIEPTSFTSPALAGRFFFFLPLVPPGKSERWKALSCVQVFATSWTIQSTEFSRPFWSGVGRLSLLRGSSQPRNQTQVFHIAGGFFTSWTTREAPKYWSGKPIPSPVDFPDLELNQGLLHCRWILYQLSCRGSQLGSPF